MTLEEIKNGQRFVFTRQDEFAGERECNIQVDDPVFDATDFAHPAWFRAEEHITNHIVNMLSKVLDGKDSGKGSISHEGLNKLRERLREMVK